MTSETELVLAQLTTQLAIVVADNHAQTRLMAELARNGDVDDACVMAILDQRDVFINELQLHLRSLKDRVAALNIE